MSDRPKGMLTTEQASFVAFSRMDLVCVLENCFNDIPVMFAEDGDLKAWCDQNSLGIESVENIPADQALITRGNYNKHWINSLLVSSLNSGFIMQNVSAFA